MTAYYIALINDSGDEITDAYVTAENHNEAVNYFMAQRPGLRLLAIHESDWIPQPNLFATIG